MRTLECKVCRKVFEARNSRSTYCTAGCRAVASNRRRRTKIQQRKCPRRGCGKMFSTKPHPGFKGPHREYCSPRCQRIVCSKCYRANRKMKANIKAYDRDKGIAA